MHTIVNVRFSLMTSWAIGAHFFFFFFSLSLAFDAFYFLFRPFYLFLFSNDCSKKNDTKRNREWTSVFRYDCFFLCAFCVYSWRKTAWKKKKSIFALVIDFNAYIRFCSLLFLIITMIVMMMMHQLRCFMPIIIQALASQYLENFNFAKNPNNVQTKCNSVRSLFSPGKQTFLWFRRKFEMKFRESESKSCGKRKYKHTHTHSTRRVISQFHSLLGQLIIMNLKKNLIRCTV